MRTMMLGLTLLLVAGCDADHGDRCNPLQYTDTANQGNCSAGFSCVYPTAPNCGVPYCCKVDPNGNISDSAPTCQPDPTAAAACALDMSSRISDGGNHD